MGISKLQINIKDHSNFKVNSFIFGNFVEDIRDHMDAMLAFIVKDMDFEGPDKNHDGVAGNWYPVTDAKNTVYKLEPSAPTHSGSSQYIRIFSEDGGYAGIAQKIALKGNKDYKVKIFARASLQIKKLFIDVIDNYSHEKIGSHVLELTSHNWKEYSLDLFVSRDSNDAEHRIWISSENADWQDTMSSGMLWIDHVSILPSDSAGIVKREVVEWARKLNTGIMRFGGNDLSAYYWENAVGPYYLRPNRSNEAWPGWMANKYFGTDEFIQFCRELEVEPQICVNAGSGTAQDAANWVQYCNGSVDTPMGALRAANGHVEPYGVKYWEIGNEIFGPWQVGHCTAEVYAERYVEFAEKMKKSDPDIILMGCGHITKKWSETLINRAGELMDYLTLHYYHGYNNSFNKFSVKDNDPREERFNVIMCYPEVLRCIISDMEEIINSDERYNHIKLAVTEHNTMYRGSQLRKGLPNEHTLEAGLAVAASFNEFIRKSGMVEICNYSDLVNGWLGGCIRVGDEYADQPKGRAAGWTGKRLTVYGSPSYHVMKVYANRDINYVAKSRLECETFNVGLSTSELNLTGLPVLDTVSCINEKKDTLTVFIVNRSLKETQLQVEIEGQNKLEKVKVWEMTSGNIDDINDVFNPDKVIDKQSEIVINSDILDYKLKAHSLYVFEFPIKL